MAMFTIALGVQSLSIVIILKIALRMSFNLVLFNAYASKTTWGKLV